MRITLLCCMLLMLSSDALSQTAGGPLKEGARVRIRANSLNGIYLFRSMSADTLALGEPSGVREFKLRLSEIRKLEVSRGMRPEGDRVLRNAGLGLATGVAFGVVVGLMVGDDEKNTFINTTGSQKAVMLGGAMGMAGLIYGVIHGLFSKEEMWLRVPTSTLSVRN